MPDAQEKSSECFYTHAMNCSLSIEIIRGDEGQLTDLMVVDVVSSAGVNAKEVSGEMRDLPTRGENQMVPRSGIF